MKRYLVFPVDFDARANSLEEEQDHWEDRVKSLHKKNRENTIEKLREELGALNFDRKLENFKQLGFAPFSMVSFHNRFFAEVRYAYIHEFYYPALTGACALGERMLNHMILELRDHYKSTPEYKKVYRKDSFDKWDDAIATLSAWGVLSDLVSHHFIKLKDIRNRSIHFNSETYSTVKDDAAEAIKALIEIISLRFGFFRLEHDWAVQGTRGFQFIGKASESNPFIKRFYIPQCPLVGPCFAVKFITGGTLFIDRHEYPDTEVTDEEFADLFNNRDPKEVVNSDFPLAEDVDPVGVLWSDGQYQLTEKA